MRTYVALMAFAASLGFGKLLLLANLLPATSFGLYATVVGAGGLLSALLSFGLIEATIKGFPRDWRDGKTGRIIGQAKVIARRILIWSGPIVVMSAVVAIFAQDAAFAMIVASAGIFAIITVLARVVSALNVAIGDRRLIQSFSLARSIATLFLTTAGGVLFGWEGAVAGEIGGGLASIAQGLLAVRSRLPLGAKPFPVTAEMHLYLSSLVTNATAMGDRPLVALFAGPTVAGSYAFAMIFAQIGQVLVNILAQKAGPDIIKEVQRGGAFGSAVRRLSLIVAATAAAAVAMFVSTSLAASIPFVEAVLSKYGVGAPELAVSCFIAITYSYVAFEFSAIAVDEEPKILMASAIAFAVFMVGCFLTYSLSGGFIWYLASFALARTIQMLIVAGAFLRHRLRATAPVAFDGSSE